MLADSKASATGGGFDDALHLPRTARYELFDYIADELPRWRDRPDRPNATSETELTSGLCAHLNTVSRFSAAWNRIQFLPEDPDETKGGRKIDMSAKPYGTIFIEGRRFTEFEKLFPIECKRLPMPTPNDKKRDDREYVINRHSSTGGIQRFKEGNHGAAHDFGGMIGYVQDESGLDNWLQRINHWISELASQPDSIWTTDDCLLFVSENPSQRSCRCKSVHSRSTSRPIELRHAWIEMN